MVVTLLQLRTRIRTEINKPSTSYEEFIDDAIRSAILFYGSSRFWFLEDSDVLTLATSGTFIDLPDDFNLPVQLRISVNSRWIGHQTGFKHVTHDELKESATDAAATGSPCAWALFGNRVYVDRISDQTYTLDLSYIRKDVTLPEADSDTSIWFDEGRDVIRLKAMEYFYRDRLHAFEIAERYEARAKTASDALTSQHNQRQLTAGILRG